MTAQLLIEYDGSGFAGWARQPGRRTVQAVIEEALSRIGGRDRPLTVAGRTDAGVHALGQVASHHGEPAPAYALNGVLPPDVRIVHSKLARDDFDARRDARSRTYRYRIFTRPVASPLERGRSLHWPHRLDRDALGRCAALVHGMHDFTAFTPAQTHHVRFEREVLRAEWVDAGEHRLEFVIEADTFMRHMVRTLVGTMLDVSRGRTSAAGLEALLRGAPRSEAGDTVAAHGLYLQSVRY